MIKNEQLDWLVAEKVMGWHIQEGWMWNYILEKGSDFEWHPTTDYNQAMEVCNKMIADGWVDTALIYDNDEWLAEFYKNEDDFDGGSARDKLLSRAIVMASLKAMEDD